MANLVLLVNINPIRDLDKPWGFQEVEVPWFQDNQHMNVIRLSALRTGHLYPQEIILVLISVTFWVNSKTVLLPKELCEWKTPMIPSVIEPTSFRFVAQCLNQLLYPVSQFCYYFGPFYFVELLRTCYNLMLADYCSLLPDRLKKKLSFSETARLG